MMSYWNGTEASGMVCDEAKCSITSQCSAQINQMMIRKWFLAIAVDVDVLKNFSISIICSSSFAIRRRKFFAGELKPIGIISSPINDSE